MKTSQIDQLLTSARSTVQELNLTHNSFAEEQAPVIELDPLPFVLSSSDSSFLAAGIGQWGRLLTAAYQDLWGDQKLLESGLLPENILWDAAAFDPTFYRSLPFSAPPLSLFRLDLVAVRGVGWRTISLGAGVPHSLGYTLENRIVHSRIFGSRLPRNKVLRLAPFFQNLKDLWTASAQSHKDEPSLMLWTPGPGDPRYFEHGYLSRYFGYPLVESRDLTVRSGKVYLKTLNGLQPVDVLIRMVNDEGLDPLAGSPHSLDGVAGILHAAREGTVLITNAPGFNLLESPALLPYWGNACVQLLGEDLLLPCGNDSGLNTEPFWKDGVWEERPFLLRIFGSGRADQWEMLPGGLVQDFGSTHKDVWVLSAQAVPFTSLLPQGERPSEISRSSDLPSRVADDLFWLGRYAERAWADLRFLEKWWELSQEGGYESSAGDRAFLRKTVSALKIGPEEESEDSSLSGWRLWKTLAQLDRVSRKVRDRLSLETHRVIGQFGLLLREEAGFDVRERLDRVSLLLAAFNGLTVENMTRSAGWRFLDMGRRLERAQIVLESAQWFFLRQKEGEHWSLLLGIFDSSMTYRTRYRLSPQSGPVLDLLLLDETNPRSLAYQLVRLESHIEELPRKESTAYRTSEERIVLDLLTRVRLADGGDLAAETKEAGAALKDFLQKLTDGLEAFNDTIHNTYLAKIEAITTIQAGKRIETP